MKPAQFIMQMARFDHTELWLVREFKRWMRRRPSRARTSALKELRDRARHAVQERERFLNGVKWGILMTSFIPGLLINSGCAWYSKQALAPDSFNYTVAVDHHNFSVDQHWFGVSWNLKRIPASP